MSIIVVDYGSGNLRSVQKAFQKLGFSVEISKESSAVKSAKGIILPGVGSFDAAIQELRNAHLEAAIIETVALGKPFLGICLGLQHLFESSEEGKLKGLCLLEGNVKKFSFQSTPWSNLSIPHMGWNRLIFKHRAPIFEGIEEGSMVYFAHSYHVAPKDEMVIASVTDYGIDFVSSVWKGNIFGIQFHPEKSGEIGMQILRNFGNLCSK